MKACLTLLLMLLWHYNTVAQQCDMSKMVYLQPDGDQSKACYEDDPEFAKRPSDYNNIMKDVIACAGLQLADIRLAHIKGDIKKFESSTDFSKPGRPAIYFTFSYIDSMIKMGGGNIDMLKAMTAHELGHILMYHILYPRSGNKNVNQGRELQADYYSGFLSYKMGVCICDALRWVYIVTREHDTHEHPARSLRIMRITDGYKYAMQQAGDSSYLSWPPFQDTVSATAYLIANNCATEEYISMLAQPDTALLLMDTTAITDGKATIVYDGIDTALHQYQIDGLGIINTINDKAFRRSRYERITITASTDSTFSKEIEIANRQQQRKDRKQTYYLDKEGQIWDGKERKETMRKGKQLR